MVKVSGNRPTTRAQPPAEPRDAQNTARPPTTPTPADALERRGSSGIRGFIENGPGQVTSTTINKAPAQGLQGVNGARPVDFAKMTQEQQYDYLQNLTVQRAGGDPSAWKSGDREVNLVGIRSFNGSPQHFKVNQYDDMIYTARMVDGKKTVDAFPASVDAGVQRNSGNSPVRLEDGFYRDAWTRGEVSGGELGLRQCRDVEVWKDSNNDGMLQPEELNAGTSVLPTDAQLQFHRGGSGAVGNASAGCQAIDADHYARFQSILAEAPASQRDFSYTLTDCSTLPGINPDGSIQRTGSDEGHTGRRRHDDGRKGGIGIIRTPNRKILS